MTLKKVEVTLYLRCLINVFTPPYPAQHLLAKSSPDWYAESLFVIFLSIDRVIELKTAIGATLYLFSFSRDCFRFDDDCCVRQSSSSELC